VTRHISCTIARDIERLFDGGTLAGSSDSQLLERFIARRDEEAFAALVARHGPMVLAVCRRVTHDTHAAEDAFQAAFLLLVRKAPHVRGSLGGWLHRVAFRVALRARKQQARRRKHEHSDPSAGLQTPTGKPEPHTMAHANDFARDLHHEIARLDHNHRLPVILCELEGLTHEQAADQLGWPLGTVKGRLARSRERLRRRLQARGYAPSAPIMAAALASDRAVFVQSALSQSTLRAARELATHAAPLTASINSLVQGEALAMTLTSPKTVSIASVAFLALVSAGWAAFASNSKVGGVDGALVVQDAERPAAAQDASGAQPPKTPAELAIPQPAAPLNPTERARLQFDLESLTLDLELLEDDLKSLKQGIFSLAQQVRHYRAAAETGIVGTGGVPFPNRGGPDLEHARKASAESAAELERLLHRSRTEYRDKAQQLQELKRQKESISTRLEAPEPHPRKVKPGDILVIEVLEALPGRPLTGERIVRPDGTIGLGFYGELRVAGLDRNEIKVALIDHMKKHLSWKSLGLVDAQGREFAHASPLESNRVFVEEVGQSSSPNERRNDDLERKLDRVLEELESLKSRVSESPPRAGR
jgi:RNA polymerase sigma factor (sigma-70 family)